MDFFSQLRRLAVTIQQEAAAVQEEVTVPPCQGAATATLYTIQEEVKKLRTDIKSGLASVQNDNGFMAAASLAIKLVEKQKAALAETETYLHKYGYIPIETTAQASPMASESIPVKQQKKEDSKRKDSSDVEEYQCLPSTPVASAPPPPPPVDLDRTPQPEDFGLTLESLQRYQIPKPTAQLPSTTAESAAGKDITTSQYNMQNNGTMCDEPEDFRHMGLCVTPGMMGGRTISTVTPFTQRDIMFNMEDSGTPELPELRTPGLAKLYSQKRTLNVSEPISNDVTPEAPHLVTPGLAPLPNKRGHEQHLQDVPKFNLESQDADVTPEPPELRTPGMSLHPKKSYTMQVPKLQLTDKEPEDSGNTPEPPKLSIAGLGMLQLNNTTVADVPKYTQDTISLSPLPPPPTQLPQSYSHLLDEMGTPEPPELTTRFEDLQRVLPSQNLDRSLFMSLDTSILPEMITDDVNELPSKKDTICTISENKHVNQRTCSSGVAIPAISADEYGGLPDYVRCKVSHDFLNTAVNKLNTFISHSANMEGTLEEIFLRPSSFKEEFGHNTQFIFLVFKQLKRLKTASSTVDSETAYCVFVK